MPSSRESLSILQPDHLLTGTQVGFPVAGSILSPPHTDARPHLSKEPEPGRVSESKRTFSYQVIELPHGEGRVVCESAGDEGYFFTLLSEDPDMTGEFPAFTLHYPHNSSELTMRCPVIKKNNIPVHLATEFLVTALSEIRRAPQELSLHYIASNLTERQAKGLEKIGFAELYATEAGLRLSVSEGADNKQAELNGELRRAEEFLASFLRGELSDQAKAYGEWLHSAHALVKLTIIKEAKDGIEAARHHLEATNAHFDKALKTFPSEMAEVAVQALDIRSQIVYAGTLARLASCTDLVGYDTKKYDQLKGCSRNKELYNKSIAIYERLKGSIDENTSQRDNSLIKSGLAQALMLYSEYLVQTEPERNGLGVVVDINRALRKRKRRGAQRRATDELKDAKKDIDDKAILQELDRQLADISTSEYSVLDGVRDGEEMQMADKVLLEAA